MACKIVSNELSGESCRPVQNHIVFRHEAIVTSNALFRPREQCAASFGVGATGPIHLIVDSTGLEVIGQGQWAAAKHGGKGIRGWRKLHIGVEEGGIIVADVVTNSGTDDASAVDDLIDQIEFDVERFTGDAAYDKWSVYEALPREVRQSWFRLPRRLSYLERIRQRVERGIGLSRASATSGDVSGRKTPAIIGRPASRTPSSATSDSSEAGSEVVSLVPKQGRYAYRATC